MDLPSWTTDPPDGKARVSWDGGELEVPVELAFMLEHDFLDFLKRLSSDALRERQAKIRREEIAELKRLTKLYVSRFSPLDDERGDAHRKDLVELDRLTKLYVFAPRGLL